jgi:hypothetical protein
MDRLQLHNILVGITENVYFQPPNNLTMKYPCITYAEDGDRKLFANNSPYRRTKRYLVTVIDRDPDSDLPDAVCELDYVSYERWFAADNLNHFVFNLFF